MLLCGLFFFSSRRRHTRCSRDWSSDVCSSDLEALRQLLDRLGWGDDLIQLWREWLDPLCRLGPDGLDATRQRQAGDRSEERRVGEEGRSRWAPYHLKKKKTGTTWRSWKNEVKH